MTCKKLTSGLFLVFLVVFANAQTIHIIPQPKQVEIRNGYFTMDQKTTIPIAQYCELNAAHVSNVEQSAAFSLAMLEFLGTL